MSLYKFRKATTDDILPLSILFKHVYIETYGVEGITHEFANFITEQFSTEKIKSDIISSKSDLWVATYKENPVGVIQLEYRKQCPIGDLIAPEVNKLYIMKRFFGKGIGQSLMEKAEHQLIQFGEKKVWLWVLESNQRAVNFYEKQGYENIGIAYFQMEVNRYKNIVMSKKL